MKYIVLVKEIHTQKVVIEANSKEEAVMRVREGEGDFRHETQYVSTMEPDTWIVEEDK